MIGEMHKSPKQCVLVEREVLQPDLNTVFPVGYHVAVGAELVQYKNGRSTPVTMAGEHHWCSLL